MEEGEYVRPCVLKNPILMSLSILMRECELPGRNCPKELASSTTRLQSIRWYRQKRVREGEALDYKWLVNSISPKNTEAFQGLLLTKKVCLRGCIHCQCRSVRTKAMTIAATRSWCVTWIYGTHIFRFMLTRPFGHFKLSFSRDSAFVSRDLDLGSIWHLSSLWNLL